MPFTEASLAAEKPKVNAECDFTATTFATHKFALAAWAQGLRHGQTNASVKGDVNRATLPEIQAYRDQRLVVLSNVVVCIVGGIPPEKALAAVAGELGSVTSSAAPVAVKALHPGDRTMTWDLKARHLMLTWPMPTVGSEDFPALVVAAQWLNMQFYSDQPLKETTGTVLAGAGLATPEGNFFYISASLRPGGSFNAVREKLEHMIDHLVAPDADLAMLPFVAQHWAQMLTTLPDPSSLTGQLPPSMTPAMVEMNIGLQWGMNEYLYGGHKAALAKRVSQITAQEVRSAAKKYLSAQSRSAVTLEPPAP